MWRFFIFLLFLIVSVWFGLEVMRHPGYLLLVYQPWLVQMPIWFALLSLLFIFSLFYLLISSIDQLHFWFFKIKNWLLIRREHRSYSKTQQGLMMLIEWRFKKAERLLLAGIKQSPEPLINYLGAAKAAQEQSAFDRRDTYIQKAYQIAPDAELAIGLCQAELAFQQGQLEQAAATLTFLAQSSPRHPRVLSMLEKVYVRLADWKNLKSLLPRLRKVKVLTAEQYALFEKNIYSELLKMPAITSLAELQEQWAEVPRALQRNAELVRVYVKQIMKLHPAATVEKAQELEELIRKVLKNQYDAELVRYYSDLAFTNVNRQLVIAGAWLKMYGPQPELFLLLGKLCVRAQLWGKAKDYFEKCLAIRPYAEATLAYGKLLEYLGEENAALEKYKEGLLKISEAQGI